MNLTITNLQTKQQYKIPEHDIEIRKRYDGAKSLLLIEVIFRGVILFSEIDAYCHESRVIEFIERLILFSLSNISKEKVREELESRYCNWKTSTSPEAEAIIWEYERLAASFGITLLTPTELKNPS